MFKLHDPRAKRQRCVMACLLALSIPPLSGCSSAASGAHSSVPLASNAPSGAPSVSQIANWSCDFPSAPTDCGFHLQAASPDRATIVGPGRDGPTAVQLTTQPGDINLFGGGTDERADLELPPSAAYCNQGQEEWWAHSLKFPGTYVIPYTGLLWNWGVVFDFHQTGPSGQPNFQVVSLPTGLELWVAGGSAVVNLPTDPGLFTTPVGGVEFDVWYDFVYHVLWSAGSDGYFQAWLNGQLVMNFSGPTLYAGQSCYLKLANYHTPLGLPVAVIHSRVVKGASRAEVELPQP